MYNYVGQLKETKELEALATQLDLTLLPWSPTGYGSVVDHRRPTTSAYQRPLDEWYKQVEELVAGELITGTWQDVMLTVINPSGQILPHRDSPLDHGVFRYHLVMQTNDYCWNLHDGEWRHLNVGEVYLMDPSVEHASINWGTTPRIHYVVDSLRKDS